MTEKIPEKTVIISSESASQMNGGMFCVSREPDAFRKVDGVLVVSLYVFRRKTIRTETPVPV